MSIATLKSTPFTSKVLSTTDSQDRITDNLTFTGSITASGTKTLSGTTNISGIVNMPADARFGGTSLSTLLGNVKASSSLRLIDYPPVKYTGDIRDIEIDGTEVSYDVHQLAVPRGVEIYWIPDRTTICPRSSRGVVDIANVLYPSVDSDFGGYPPASRLVVDLTDVWDDSWLRLNWNVLPDPMYSYWSVVDENGDEVYTSQEETSTTYSWTHDVMDTAPSLQPAPGRITVFDIHWLWAARYEAVKAFADKRILEPGATWWIADGSGSSSI